MLDFLNTINQLVFLIEKNSVNGVLKERNF